MIYYTYKIQFTDFNGHNCVVSQTRGCEDIDYPTNLEETKLIVSQQAWAVNNFDLVTDFIETTTNITLAEYNKIVIDPSGPEPIPDWDPTQPLNNEPDL
jgi:hypothetical protein